ncbi:MAG: hypothetical protein Q9169_005442 [Polycauliona sp. 2 TL-2023]
MAVLKPRNDTGFGLPGITWRLDVIPEEQAFPAKKAAITNDKVTLFIRACFDSKTLLPVCTRTGVRASAEECIKALGGYKEIDIFGPARIDRKVSLEETLGALKELVGEELVGTVGLSEFRAPTINKAHAICPLNVVEVEFSLWSPDILTNGVSATCKELDVPILTYAPLGYGFLTGRVTELEDVPKGDIRRMFGRFQPEVCGELLFVYSTPRQSMLSIFPKNLKLVNKTSAFRQTQRPHLC